MSVQFTTKQADVAMQILGILEENFPEDDDIQHTLPVLKVIFEAIQEQLGVMNAEG